MQCQQRLRNRFVFAFLGSIGVACRPARAQSAESPTATSRIAVGAHGGFELPMGEAYGGYPVHDIVTSSIPAGVDLGYRFDQRLYIGLYGQYGFANARQSSCIGCGHTSDAHP